jgi:RNA recognition motif-containing protein
MGTRLYVGNLPFSADEEQVRELFAQNGRNVVEVKLVTDRDTGRPRGFGFVEMGSSEDADGAIRDLNGRDYGGRPLTVNEARERTAGGGGGGGGFGGGGGTAAVVARRAAVAGGGRWRWRRQSPVLERASRNNVWGALGAPLFL